MLTTWTIYITMTSSLSQCLYKRGYSTYRPMRRGNMYIITIREYSAPLSKTDNPDVIHVAVTSYRTRTTALPYKREFCVKPPRPSLLTCIVTSLSSTMTSLVRKSAPMVALYCDVNFLLTYWFISEVFPTLWTVCGEAGNETEICKLNSIYTSMGRGRQRIVGIMP